MGNLPAIGKDLYQTDKCGRNLLPK